MNYKTTYNGQFPLIDIPKDETRSYLSYYVITDTPSTAREYKDTGSIVILTNHPAKNPEDFVGENEYGDKFAIEYPGTYLYTDLYVGDEHIAGGYGFDSPFTRDQILSLPDKLQKIEERIDGYHLGEDNETPDNPGESKEQKTVQVDPIYNIVDTGDKLFELSLDETDQSLSFLVSHKPIIRNAVLTYVVENQLTGETYYYEQLPDLDYREVTKSKKYSYITFDYEGNDDLYAFYITYSFDIKGYTPNNSSDYDNDFIGSFAKPIKIDYNNGVIEDLHVLKDPSYHPDVVQRRIRIYFNKEIQDKFVENSYFEGIIRYRLHVLTTSKTLTKISFDICKLGFTFPCFYKVGKPDSWESINSSSTDWGSFIMVPQNDSVRVMFRHEGETEDYEYLLVPQTILKHTLDLLDINCVLDTSNVKFKWATDDDGFKLDALNRDKQINYYKLRSPQKYKGQVIWNFSIE